MFAGEYAASAPLKENDAPSLIVRPSPAALPVGRCRTERSCVSVVDEGEPFGAML
jgi:hypothetical protein